jgi:MFS family permease
MSTALALEAAVNTATFMAGPVLVTSLSATVHPSRWAWWSRRAWSWSSRPCSSVVDDSEPPSQARGPGLVLDARLLDRALLPFPALHLLLGIYFGGMTICLTAAALSLGVAPYAGLIAAGAGAAGLLAGFVYGASSHRIGTAQVMLLGSAGLVLFCFGLSQSHGLVSLVLLTTLAGACVSPIVIPAAVKLQEAAPASLYVQAITWTGSASALGTAIAAPLIGQLVDQWSVQAGYLAITVVLSLLLIVTALLARDRRPSPAS